MWWNGQWVDLGGSRGPVDPGEVPGLHAWWSASDLLHLSDDALVGEWPDRSGNGHDLAATSAETRPTLHHSPDGFNGLPAVYFGGAMTTGWGVGLAQPWHAFFVIRGTAITGGHYIMDGQANGQRLAIYRTTVGSSVSLYAGGTDVRGGSGSRLDTHTLSATANGAFSQLRQNGWIIATGNPGTNSLSGVTIGTRFNGVDPLNGWIAEGILYRGALSQEDVTAVDLYLLAKYNLTN